MRNWRGWVAHGTLRRLEAGQLLAHKGQAVDAMHVILSGRVALFVDRGAGPHKMVQWREGDVMLIRKGYTLVRFTYLSCLCTMKQIVLLAKEVVAAL